MSEYRWESGRGMRDYYVDATGRIVGETFYFMSDGTYEARAGAARIGEYLNATDARAAVECAIILINDADTQARLSKPDIIPRLPE